MSVSRGPLWGVTRKLSVGLVKSIVMTWILSGLGEFSVLSVCVTPKNGKETDSDARERPDAGNVRARIRRRAFRRRWVTVSFTPEVPGVRQETP
jgi:hypothetical protein